MFLFKTKLIDVFTVIVCPARIIVLGGNRKRQTGTQEIFC